MQSFDCVFEMLLDGFRIDETEKNISQNFFEFVSMDNIGFEFFFTCSMNNILNI